MSELIQQIEPILVQVYQDTKKAIAHGWHKAERFNRGRQLVKLVELMRATETTNTKTIAFQTDGLSAPLARKLIGPPDCSRDVVFSWAKSERMWKIRDKIICQEAGVPIGTLLEARYLVLSSRDQSNEDVMTIISRAFGWGALDEGLDRKKAAAIKQNVDLNANGIYAGDLRLIELFKESFEDVPLENNKLTGDEIPIGVATSGENETTILLLSGVDVIRFHNNKMFTKFQDLPIKESITNLVSMQKTLANDLALFIYHAFAAFSPGTGVACADSYLTGLRFVQKFLSLSTVNLTRPVDDEQVSREIVGALLKDAVRLEHIRESRYPCSNEKLIELSFQELRDVHNGQAELSAQQSSRIVHDLSWQDNIYREAPTGEAPTIEILAGTLSDDEKREKTLKQIFSNHETSIKRSRRIKVSDQDSLNLNLAVMCYNRLVKNEHATAGFEEVLRKDKTTIVISDQYKAIYTPHSGAAVLYFSEECFSGLEIMKYQPTKGKQESLLGLIAVLHDQLKGNPEGQNTVNVEVYKQLKGGLHNITVVQDKMLRAVREDPQIRNSVDLKVSNLYTSISNYTDNVRVRKWLEREILAFLAWHGILERDAALGFSSMYSAFRQYYDRMVPGIEVLVDKPGNLDNAHIRVSSTEGSFVLCQSEIGFVFKVRNRHGDEIKKIEDLTGILRLACRPGSEPKEEYTDVHLKRQDLFH